MSTVPILTAIDKLRSARRIGLLFSGGSMRCIFQVGVTETLQELGIRPAVCLGVSGGAWNAAAVAVGNVRLRRYWRFFARLPHIDLSNLLREHSPFNYSRAHHRAFCRYVSAQRIPSAMPLYIALTRLRDRSPVIVDLRTSPDPFRVLLASIYLPPFFTHPLDIEGERYGDGGITNNLPYEWLFDQGCDVVVAMASKGESEGGLHRNFSEADHDIPSPYRDRMIVIRPRHRLPLGFIERRWDRLSAIADLGRLRAREVLLGERHPETDLAARGRAPTAYVSWMFSRRGRTQGPSGVL